MKIEIGAYEAKTNLPRLLQEVRAGKQFTITNRGKAVADLIPSRSASLQGRRAAVDKFNRFLKDNPVTTRTSVKQLKADGRG